jgi:hypothetical protein
MTELLESAAAKQPRLLDRVRDAIRRRNYSYRAEEACEH